MTLLGNEGWTRDCFDAAIEVVTDVPGQPIPRPEVFTCKGSEALMRFCAPNGNYCQHLLPEDFVDIRSDEQHFTDGSDDAWHLTDDWGEQHFIDDAWWHPRVWSRRGYRKEDTPNTPSLYKEKEISKYSEFHAFEAKGTYM